MADREMDATSQQQPERLRRVDLVMEIVGIALLPVGLTALVAGWLGVASNGLVFLQLPYVVSGGLVGLGLIFASGVIYLASWISRASAVQRRQNAELIEAVAGLQRTLAVLPLAGVGQGSSPGNGHTSGPYVATPNGSMFHRPECAVVSARDDTREVDPDESGMQPCGMCDPLRSDEHLDPEATTVIPVTNQEPSGP